MNRTNRLAALLVLSGVCPWADAQTPPAPGKVSATQTRQTAPTTQASNAPLRRKSIVHHYPYPYPEYYQGERSAGFRNPGGVGRY